MEERSGQDSLPYMRVGLPSLLDFGSSSLLLDVLEFYRANDLSEWTWPSNRIQWPCLLSQGQPQGPTTSE